jgi:acyl carrier protein
MNASDIRATVIQLIRELGFFLPSDASNTHLFHDVAIDSFSFITLLIRIEEMFDIAFDITQMENCAQLDHLLELIDRKVGENGHD